MQTKLTLRIDEDLVARAKEWSRQHEMSLSQLVAGYLDHLTKRRDEEELSEWVRDLMGPPRTHPAPTDEEARQAYHDYLVKKYS
jgi:hypothetical protein